MTSAAPTGRRRAAPDAGERAKRAVTTRVHWLVLAVMLVALAAALVVHGYLDTVARGPDTTAEAAATDAVPAEMTTGGPVTDASDEVVRTAGPEDRTVALTFDDGPDPRWTPEILRVLGEHGATATFFVLGEAVAANPALAAQIVAEGHEIATHSFTHVDLGTAPSWQRDLELAATQRVVTAATGVTASLFRPPYGSTNAQATNSTWAAIEHAGADGYLTVLSTLDSRDWTTPGAAEIAAASLPDGNAGEILLMHDGGGDRSQTVEALDDILTSLEQRGFSSS
jgi:peptidoglycan/xylan/chitin deacetylase (PgdA/CDA1 family)